MQCNVSPVVSAAVVSYPEATSHVTLAKEISGAGTLTCTDTEKASMVVQVSIKYRQTLLTRRMRWKAPSPNSVCVISQYF